MSCTEEFPDHLLSLIKTSKYVHVATSSKDCVPSVSLMNYTYIPKEKSYKDDKSENAYIIFATLDNTEKYDNMLTNPTVSLLFHDWITANSISVRKTELSRSGTPTQSDVATPKEGPIVKSTPSHPSKLLNLLQELNQSELNQMSATIRGHATTIQPNSDESNYYKSLLLKTNPDAGVFILAENTVIVKVKIESAKVTDSENHTAIYD
ncbi:pyridoxal 5'-phosphate synthase NDAI_0J00280 [Naumovozyma dairenensis CBS 421]|uniref:Pyridoxamine 5'-phosphate oxidase N-terminal domain-containing protein n=1 Tax=Naumovozyma dairenensis (strain ATCC 10597 / BCRC 20456 / CBS 421 / NBRC 0211 / NRRL Y-12639) TaxID=1071378 RepID=G0WGJ2_NAUDC|nr:hypothetical protein NDAI_0J00280 [Naumovozyma dairenensis CBS 421]CCD26920.1 hypothetical protein NDAI_0J00280 [Naumovozyma dairenensis CBS 421]